MTVSKIQIKVGIVEFSGEGDQVWLAAQFDKILAKVPELLKIEVSAPSASNSNGNTSNANLANNISSSELNLSVVNIAAKLSCKSGQDLAEAAACYLRFVENKPTFSRDEILKTMKNATGYYKSTFSNNLSQILLALVKNGTFRQTSNNIYSLDINKEKEFNDRLTK